MSLLNLEGRVAFVTGSTRGIGWLSASLLAKHGATIILNGARNAAQLNDRVQELRDAGAREVHGVLADVSDPNAVRDAYRDIFKRYKRLDILVNNAGILQDALLGMIGDDAVQRSYAVNTYSVIYNMQNAARLMARGGGGSIINVASIIGTHGNAGQVVYGGTKAAIIGMTKSAAKELAPQQVRVNAVAPGFIDTDMSRQLPPDIFAARVASVGMGRAGTPEDVARVVLFLASDLSSYVTGQTIGVDGAMLI